jgi:ADP-heptose:LPS heptosyltransferase
VRDILVDKVLVYLANGLGNCILAIPALKALGLLGYKIDLAIPKDYIRSKPLFELFSVQDFINKIYQNSSGLKAESYDRIFLPSTQEGSNLKSFLEYSDRAIIIKNPSWRESLAHESEFFMAMPRSLGYRGPAPSCSITMTPPAMSPRGPYTCLALSCLEGYPWSLKRWPLDYWKQLLCILLDELTDHNFVFIGAKSDKDDASNIERAIKSERVINYCGAYSVPESAHILSQSRVLVTIDNGISHLAAASGVDKMIALYGPTMLSKNIPLGKEIHVLRGNAKCSPCFETSLFRRCEINECMLELTPDIVAKYVISVLTD